MKKIAYYIYKFYLIIINFIGHFSVRLSPAARETMMFISNTFLIIIGIWGHASDSFRLIIPQPVVLTVSVIMMILLLASSIDRWMEAKDSREINVNYLFWIGWFLCFATMLISSFFHLVVAEYRLWSILALLIFPPFFIIWHERGDYDSLFSIVCNSLVIICFVFFIINLIFAIFVPENYAEYVGIMRNPNSVGLISICFFAAALYLLITDRTQMVTYGICIGICLAFSYLSMSRTSLVSMAVTAIIAGIYYMRLSEIKDSDRLFFRVVTLLLAIFISAAVSSYVLKGSIGLRPYAADIQLNRIHEITLASDASEEGSSLFDSMDSLSSGRFKIWNAFISASGIAGHGYPTAPLIEDVPVSQWAHNNLIEILYVSGGIAAAGYLLWLVSGIVLALQCIFNRRYHRREYFLTIISVISYTIYAMMETMLYPSTTYIAMLAVISLAPAVFHTAEESKSSTALRRRMEHSSH